MWIRGATSGVVVFVVGGISIQEIRRVSIEIIALQQQRMTIVDTPQTPVD